jgi:iron complex transport system substrate-binding protein
MSKQLYHSNLYMRKSLLYFSTILILTGTSLFGNPIIWAETDKTVTIVDADGSEVVVAKNPDRVIVHHTSLLGLWYLAGGIVKGRPESRGYGIPPEAAFLPVTGTVTYPNLEIIISLEPDLVILGNMNTHRELKDILTSLGVECLLLNYDNYSDFANLLDAFSRLTGKNRAAETIRPGIVEQIRAARDKHDAKTAPSFLSLFASTRSISAELDEAHTAHIASLLGAKNIAEEIAGDFKTKRIPLSLERIVEQDPDFILITPMGDLTGVRDNLRRDMASSRAWSGLTAVRENKVFYLPEDLFLYRPNERFPEAFEYLDRILYGDR